MNLYQDVFFRSLDILRGRKTIKRLHFLRKSQKWSVDEIKKWQLERLNQLVKQARENSPYYKDRLSNINIPFASLDEVTELPILTKDDIRKNQKEIKCTNIPDNRFEENRTGGSTGEPMYYYWDKRGMDWNRASVYRSAEWGNTKFGEKTVQMSGSHFDYNTTQSLQYKLVYFLQRFKDFSVAFMTDEILENYYQDLLSYKPTSIWGYASGLNIFAEFIEEHHPDTNFSFIQAIMTSSEMLWPKQRETINRVFGKNKVYDQYGSREMYIGSECSQHNGYHVHAEIILAEVVKPDGSRCQPGELGKILLTDLSNHAFPFIRYEIGDLGILEEEGQCECGMSLPKIRSVQGRIADVITLKDRILTPPNFATLFSDMRGIKAYQIRQDKPDEIEIVMVPDEDYSDEFEIHVRKATESMVDGVANVKTTLVDSIEVPESGKRRFIVSNISKEHF